MRIYLTQHGLAVPKDVDRDRPLREQGHQDVQRLADLLHSAGIQVEHVRHSGKTRAEQTAEILAEHLLPTGQPQAHDGLGPNDPVEALAKEIASWCEDSLIVGHLPFLGRLASLLLGSEPDRPMLAFQPGSMACLERGADNHWLLLWMIRPEIMATRRG